MNEARCGAPLIVGAFVLTAALLGCAPETVQRRYDTHALAERKGAIQAGWLPTWLPKTATDVAEIHSIDTNAGMWAAAVPVGQEVSLPANCISAVRSQLLAPPFKTAWWPEPEFWPTSTPGTDFIYFTCGIQNDGLAQEGGMLFGWAGAR
jgi:hypothetical protein